MAAYCEAVDGFDVNGVDALSRAAGPMADPVVALKPSLFIFSISLTNSKAFFLAGWAAVTSSIVFASFSFFASASAFACSGSSPMITFLISSFSYLSSSGGSTPLFFSITFKAF